MQISKRLEAVASFVEQGSVIADVGCDHGYIPIYLYQKGMIPKAIAMDVNKGPLERAEIHIREYGLGEYITTRLSDGVRALKPNEADAVVIAGMGGALMEKIIEEGEETLKSVSYLILQPQSELAHFLPVSSPKRILYRAGKNGLGRWQILSNDEGEKRQRVLCAGDRLPFWKGTLRRKKSSALSVFIERTKVFGNGKSTLRVSKYKDRKGTPKRNRNRFKLCKRGIKRI